MADAEREPPLGGHTRHSGHANFAYRLRNQYHTRLMYVVGVGWHAWEGNRWRYDADDHAAARAVLSVVRDAWNDVAAMGQDSDERKALIKDIKSCETSNGISGVMQIGRRLSPFHKSPDDIDSDAYLFNTHTGTHDLHSGATRTHAPTDYITKLAGASPDESATPVFDQFLERILPDPEVRAFVQRLFGSALCGQVRDHVLPIFTGEGANGKSTLENVIRAAFGDYAINVDPSVLMAKKHDGVPTERMDLMGARLVFAHETGQGRQLDAAAVKALTGGDRIRARRMRQDTVEFTPSHTLIMVTNHLPRVSAEDPALWRRLHIVPFDVVIPPWERDLDLPDRLNLELSGIMRWLLDGHAQYSRIGLMPPESVTNATDRYKTSSDALQRFIEEKCDLQTPDGAPLQVEAGRLYAAFRDWCQTNKEVAMSAHEFKPAMERHGYPYARTNAAGRIYQGLNLPTYGYSQSYIDHDND